MAAQIDVSKLNSLSPEIIINQSTINIGTIGHVAHGKSTVVYAISGESTIRWKKELERNITIRLGYANAKIYKCPQCPAPQCYISRNSEILTDPRCPHCSSPIELIRHVSFVDCPGHDVLMATMLNGTAVMDAALLLIAANEHCPQPQTCEHLAAVEIMNLKHIIILQNKIDLVRQDEAADQYQAILKYTATTAARGSPVIPISAQLTFGVDAAVERIVETIPIPVRDYSASARMVVIRSFDINKPGTDVRQLEGGVAGGSILVGCLRVGEEIEIRPGQLIRDEDGKQVCQVRRARITSLKADHNPLQFAVPGGLIGIKTTLDPSLCRADRLAGQVIGQPGTLPEVYIQLSVSFRLLHMLLGVVNAKSAADTKITALKLKEVLMVNVGSTSTGAQVIGIKDQYAILSLREAVCTKIGERIALSRKIERTWRLIGWARILKGETIPTIEP
ncbi:heterochromatin protein, putative [Trichomonas vaginalis G3]|uniref:protein-synthesizing GTPase n=2 Tax=Trichomonas vaginalis TaxID=5722 RepID=A2DTI7_TRIV3|nr:eukaryotic translation initiation factor 2 subunit 3 family member family [Trichomonas vaginalis G3]EAY16296.1 heterochromatin protein, putative [Trichomonas vaginalis G3]KAI5523445.1 eukaryotic translation initiation factor 2 subunit 3 family member family [Trichomonas vaginalis G3]|eukprot:XP_001328519.1 heterochromatin protein [Trichomonas vaginalis G3]